MYMYKKSCARIHAENNTYSFPSVGFPAQSTLQMIMNGILELLVYRMSVDMGEGGMVCISPGMNIMPFLVKVKIRMCALLMPHRYFMVAPTA